MIINKTMEPSDLTNTPAAVIIAELNDLVKDLKKRGLKVSSWYGSFDLSGRPNSLERLSRGYNYQPLKGTTDDKNHPWFLYWEIAWIVMHAGFKKGDSILDMGGSSSLFSYYLASKGYEVVTIDIQENLVNNANKVAEAMSWNLKNTCMDMRELDFNRKFNHITSICVYEHIPMYDRVEINGKVKELLKDNGHFSITFDYRNPQKGAEIGSPEAVEAQFVTASGLSHRFNPVFYDTGNSYLLSAIYNRNISMHQTNWFIGNKFFRLKDVPIFLDECDYTFGSLFLEKIPET